MYCKKTIAIGLSLLILLVSSVNIFALDEKTSKNETDVKEISSDEGISNIEDIVSVLDDVDSEICVEDVSKEGEEYVAEIENLDVYMPVEGGNDVELILAEEEGTIEIELPSMVNNMSSEVTADGSVYYSDGNSDASIILQAISEESEGESFAGIRQAVVIENADAPAGCTPQQAKYYEVSDTNRYTYIFYQKKKSAKKCTLSFMYADSSPVSPGAAVRDPIEIEKGSKFKLFPTAPAAPSGYDAPYWLAGGKKVDTTAGVEVNEDITFVLVYNEKKPNADQVWVTWLDESGNVYQKNLETKAAEGSFQSATEPGGSPYDADKFDHEWVEQSTGTKCSEVNINGPKTFVAKKIAKPKLTFSTNGTDVDSEIYVSKGTKMSAVTIPNAVPSKIPSDKIFDKWVIDGKESEKIEDYTVNEDTKFKCVFKDKPPIPSGSSVVKIHVKSIFSYNNNAAVTCSNQAADFSVSGDATVARHKGNHYGDILVNQLGENRNFEFTFYTPDITIQLQWAGARKFENNGSVYEVWYKDGNFYDTDPG